MKGGREAVKAKLTVKSQAVKEFEARLFCKSSFYTVDYAVFIDGLKH